LKRKGVFQNNNLSNVQGLMQHGQWIFTNCLDYPLFLIMRAASSATAIDN
jgi:hypothetical protein